MILNPLVYDKNEFIFKSRVVVFISSFDRRIKLLHQNVAI